MTDNNHFRTEAKADEFGPEIKVEGKRPEWLGDDGKQVVAYNRRLSDHWFGMREGGSTFYIRDIEEAGDGNGWADVTAIRLPANHPHYAQNAPETHRQGTNGVRTSQECLERMEALVRRMAALQWEDGDTITKQYEEALAIVRDLPEPVDPVEAIVDELMRKDCTTRQAITEAVFRGRALERGEG